MSLPVSPSGRRYGLKASPPDPRDLHLRSAPIKIAPLPPVVDLETWCGPVKDQGSLGACTAFAGAGNREYLARRFNGEDVILSPLYLYYQERFLDGTLAEGDTGSTGRTSCRAMNKFGICEETEDRYDVSRFMVAPTPEQCGAAIKYRAGAYHALLTPYDLKTCMASGYPALVGFTVYESFESSRVAETGVWSLPDKRRELVLGGHEVLFVGYDDQRAAFKVRNSWGPDWGQRGNFWFPYAAAGDPDILMDAWMQHLGKPWGRA